MISLFGLFILFTGSSHINADEVCATESLESDWKAGQICPQVCKDYKDGYIWNKIWFPSMRGKGCMNEPSTKHNGADSVCQCDLQPCSCDEDGKQRSKCDENLNRLGANQCSSNCDCVEGRICKEGWCKDAPPITTPCCQACFLKSNSCNHPCGLTDVVCLGRCYAIWLICANNCPQGCFGTSETKHNNESSETEKSPLPNDGEVKETPKESEKPPANEPLKTIEPTKEPKKPSSKS